MVFNSYTFIIFLGLVLLLHNLPLSWRVRKFNLLLASYVFYAAWNPPFVILLWISTVADWFIARGLDRATRTFKRRSLLVASLCVNLGLLGFFKYSGFLLDNFVTILAALGVEYRPATPSIVLPVGISFYTFQTLSYTIDIYRRQSRPWSSFLDYALYVTFFPQLVAGPIVRATDFLPQCRQPRRASGSQFGWGMSLLVLGLFQKIVLADALLAPYVEGVYDTAANVDPLNVWAGTFAFAGQIFCDFAGYSTCAIGVAMCLGFALPDNFRFPYAAIGFSDFWRRWHISLSSWLRDYLYIPLGGNRHGTLATQCNLMVTMLLGGLWHGASWTFVAWGGLHGGYLIGERVLTRRFGAMPVWQRPTIRFALGMLTFVLICFTWIFFRAHNFGQAWQMVHSMTMLPDYLLSYLQGEAIRGKRAAATVLAVMTPLLAAHWFMRDRSLEMVAEKCPWFVRAIILASMLLAIVLIPGEDRAFIYFQF